MRDVVYSADAEEPGEMFDRVITYKQHPFTVYRSGPPDE